MTIPELEERLKAHDFYHDWSEDENVWRKGADDKEQIMVAMRRVPLRELVRLIKTFIPGELRVEWMQQAASHRKYPWLR